eukprot:836096-Prorocentrum_minimum.AAC.1
MGGECTLAVIGTGAPVKPSNVIRGCLSHLGIFSGRTNQMLEAWGCSQDGPIRRWTRGDILRTDQSDESNGSPVAASILGSSMASSVCVEMRSSKIPSLVLCASA